MFQDLQRRAEELGLPFAPPEALANTRKALLLAEYARDAGRLEALHPLLFRAFFAEGRNLAEEAVLREVAERAGLDPQAAMAAVRSGRYEQRLADAAALARQYGITAVPTFIIDGRYRVVGAQPYEALRDALRGLQQPGGPA